MNRILSISLEQNQNDFSLQQPSFWKKIADKVEAICHFIRTQDPIPLNSRSFLPNNGSPTELQKAVARVIYFG